MQKINFLFFILFILILNSCSKDTEIPNVSDIKVNLNINRFEKDLFSIDTTQIAIGLKKLEEKYPTFSDLYFKQVLPLNVGGEENPFPQNISSFINYPSIRALYDTTLVVFPHLDLVEKDMEKAFQFYKYYFPQKEVPNIYSFISEYSYQTFIFDDSGKDAIGLGLDMFLGEDYPYRQYVPENPSFSAYLTRAFTQKYVTKKVMETIIDDMVGLPRGNKLLDIIVNNGKKMYLLDLFLPTTPDTIKWEYTPAQITWCQENELPLWTYLLNEDLLYSDNNKKIRKLVDPSPQGPSNMPPEAPGRTGNWAGWKIVKAYMQRNPNLTLEDLLIEKDAQIILDKSRYRPR